jgi:hypothetical protein
MGGTRNKNKNVWLIFAWYVEVRNIFAGSNSEVL